MASVTLDQSRLVGKVVACYSEREYILWDSASAVVIESSALGQDALPLLQTPENIARHGLWK